MSIAIGTTITHEMQRKQQVRMECKRRHAKIARQVLASDSRALLKHTMRKFRATVSQMSAQVRAGFEHALVHGDDAIRQLCVEFIHDAVLRELDPCATEVVYPTGSVIWGELHLSDREFAYAA